ncbi:MAG: nucleotidyl transferase AbiEii/AbiGii toxin family protein [Acidobacteria bacterium]|nr:nucleotidyl transferase AbiEii/AbiGii toxin family protein [Acidobacteriota bacterium]
MPTSRRYATAGAFRQALEERLKAISRAEGTNLQRLCRQVAFDRFLARLALANDSDWILKGGYAMELRFDTARSTRDLDFTLRAGNSDTALPLLQRAAALDAGDFFTFRVGEAMADLDAAPYGGARYPGEARLDGRTFVRFHIDAGIGDVILQPIETTTTRDWFAFAGIAPPTVPMIAREQQFAEKVHAYSVPRSNPNSRVRDLIDLHLLVGSGSLDPARCREALRQTFGRRATHELPRDLVPPPPGWDLPFQALAEGCELEIDCQTAFDFVRRFWTGLSR